MLKIQPSKTIAVSGFCRNFQNQRHRLKSLNLCLLILSILYHQTIQYHNHLHTLQWFLLLNTYRLRDPYT